MIETSQNELTDKEPFCPIYLYISETNISLSLLFLIDVLLTPAPILVMRTYPTIFPLVRYGERIGGSRNLALYQRSHEFIPVFAMRIGGGGNPRLIIYTHYFFFEKYM
jgi:hypothetical protein